MKNTMPAACSQSQELLNALDAHCVKHAQKIESCMLEILQAHENRMTNVVQMAVQKALQSTGGTVLSHHQNGAAQAPIPGAVNQENNPMISTHSTSKIDSEPFSNVIYQDANAMAPSLRHSPSAKSEPPAKTSTRGSVKLNTVKNTSQVATLAKSHTGWQDGDNGFIKRARRFIQSTACDNFIGFLIILNAALIAYQTEFTAQNPRAPIPGWLRGVDLTSTIIFTVEVVLRILVDGKRFLIGRQRGWNLFDLSIVLIALVEEFLASIENAIVIRVLRILRLVKVVRVLRTLRVFSDLRAMIQGICGSLISVIWALGLLLIIFFVFGIFLTQMVTHRLHNDDLPPLDSEVTETLEKSFCSLGVTMYSLYKSITGGDDWSHFSDPLFEVDKFVGCLFCFYIAFTVFAVLNVVTGVFVENAIKINAKDADMIIMEQMYERRKHIEDVKKVFEKADSDGSGKLDSDEFEKHIDNVCVQAYFRQLDLDVEGQEAQQVFELLDFDGSGSIDIDEFVFGCSRLKGAARSLDLARVEHGHNTLRKEFETLMEYFQRCQLNIENISKAVGELRSEMKDRSPVSLESAYALRATMSNTNSRIVVANEGTAVRGENSTVNNWRPSSAEAVRCRPVVPGSVSSELKPDDSDKERVLV